MSLEQETQPEAAPPSASPSIEGGPFEDRQGFASVLSSMRPNDDAQDDIEPGAEEIAPVENTSAPEDMNPAEEPTEPAEPANAAADEGDSDAPVDIITALGELEQEEQQAVLESFQEWLRTQDTAPAESEEAPEEPDAPASPTPEQVQQAQEAELRQLMEAAGSDFDLELTEDDMLDGAGAASKVKTFVQGMLAKQHGRQVQETARTLIPIVGSMMESMMVGMLAEQQYPELEGKVEDLVAAAGVMRRDNPDMEPSALFRGVVEKLRKDTKTGNALEKLIKSGKGFDARGGGTPQPSANSASSLQAPTNPNTKRQPPVVDTIERLKAAYNKQ